MCRFCRLINYTRRDSFVIGNSFYTWKVGHTPLILSSAIELVRAIQSRYSNHLHRLPAGASTLRIGLLLAITE